MTSFVLASCATKGEETMSLSRNLWKGINNSNPISPNVFCADPTSVEYQGRIYVYGTNDHEQYLKAQKNTYDKIKSLVCFSTDDMVNWTYHGEINVGKIAPWIYNSWAPSICSRVEEDGLTHFYLYFSNNGTGVGVITATSPLGPWSDPLKKPLIKQGMKGLENSPNPFDPGVCIDDKGDGWLVFGAGIGKNGGTKAMPGSANIVKLGKDMISFASDFVQIKAPYSFEANEIDFMNGSYVYTYNTSWDERSEWPFKDIEKAPTCSMCYMTSKTPLDADSWLYQKHYFKNPGEMGLNYSNNHTHLQKFHDKWYLLYHTLTLQEKAPTSGGFRSMCVDEIQIDEKVPDIKETTGSRKGLAAIKNLNPFEKVAGTTMLTSADIWYSDIENPEKIAARAESNGAWIFVKNVDFGQGADVIEAKVKGSGSIQIRINKASETLAVIKPKATSIKEGFTSVNAEFNQKITGCQDIWIVFTNKGDELLEWSVK